MLFAVAVDAAVGVAAVTVAAAALAVDAVATITALA